ncbi:acyltransferase domain-containing protein [Salinispora arenicola]|uniref:[acyl-carrier-protein] S-malonyltransferase n=2 Tax=Salinispora arenicola TaxID=168697 RepID=A0A542XP14_SALAC|nr:acyltransferase domain-containing protein [Salinispora arenicola]MCN0154440.1 acyltransferase domain-containing protein [Salinispora arenicola]MCN0178860.1 acyltransferase domain-containing protein [Salinispora arenicola]NIL59270.1 acyltransferase domain-containing protein [Salinispora arenicola]NIL60151.1 acyltransferase domain-containing protein [Salinispora arenicola]TQL37596.1 [acyl-carrier-protein] S-malonyltransferase [Salinispora arenicola]
MLAVLSPGQGSQKPGFLTPWLDLPGTEARLRWWSALAGVDLVHLGTAADADEIKDTARTQPLLVAAALLAAEHLPMHDVTLTAGHSVGELGATSLAGVLTPEAAVTLAAVRGREMAAACALEPTGMAAMLGGDPDEVLAAIDAHGLHPANRNGAGQIVVAGSLAGLDKLAAEPPARTRVVRLKVAGAFHTPYMASAETALAAVAAGVTPADPTHILLSNLDGAAVNHGREMVQRLIRQITAPVRWDLCLRTLADLGVTGVIELPPAGALAGLVKRELKGDAAPEIVTLNTPDDLPAARDLIARHSGLGGHEPVIQFRVVVSPAAGTFTPVDGLAEGVDLRAGQIIGHIATRQGSVEVTAHDSGLLTEWLAHHDDPVAPGQPLARIGGHT